MILQFQTDPDGNIKLKRYQMVDISNDMRTTMLNRNTLTSDLYKIKATALSGKIFFIKQDFFIYMATIIDKPDAKSLYIRYSKVEQVIIVGEKDHVFLDGQQIYPKKYNLPISERIIRATLGV